MDKNITPVVSILMPVYNAAPFLHAAISSVLNQTFTDFELFIFNDASTDQSEFIIKNFKDQRIRFFTSKDNRGYVYHLNEGIRMARGKYIARMDADDVSEKERLEKQVQFMDDNPEIGVCGAQIMIINDSDCVLGLGKHYLKNEELRVRLFFDSCFAHPVVIIRKSVLIDNNFLYDEELIPAEDYALWNVMSYKCKLANLSDLLLKYRVHPKQVTQSSRSQQKKSAAITRRKIVEKFIDHQLNDPDFEFHNSLLEGDYVYSKDYIIKAKAWIEYLIKENEMKNHYEVEFFHKEMAKIWFSLCTHAYGLGPWIIRAYFSSAINDGSISRVVLLRFVFKSVFRLNLKY